MISRLWTSLCYYSGIKFFWREPPNLQVEQGFASASANDVIVISLTFSTAKNSSRGWIVNNINYTDAMTLANNQDRATLLWVDLLAHV